MRRLAALVLTIVIVSALALLWWLLSRALVGDAIPVHEAATVLLSWCALVGVAAGSVFWAWRGDR